MQSGKAPLDACAAGTNSIHADDLLLPTSATEEPDKVAQPEPSAPHQDLNASPAAAAAAAVLHVSTSQAACIALSASTSPQTASGPSSADDAPVSTAPSAGCPQQILGNTMNQHGTAQLLRKAHSVSKQYSLGIPQEPQGCVGDRSTSTECHQTTNTGAVVMNSELAPEPSSYLEPMSRQATQVASSTLAAPTGGLQLPSISEPDAAAPGVTAHSSKNDESVLAVMHASLSDLAASSSGTGPLPDSIEHLQASLIRRA